jgi:putative transposase
MASGYQTQSEEFSFVTKKAIRQMADRKKSAMLITDGGSEFDNVLMRTALAGTGLELKIAGKDVEFSNSMIEAVNKSLKYRHIFPRELPKASRLMEYIQRYIEEYNDRPHTKLKGLTPNEVYSGYEFDEQMYRLLLADAREKRMEDKSKFLSAMPACTTGVSIQ